jgi:hypothetical protein
VAKPDLDALKREIMSLSEARTASRLAVVAESGTRSKEQKLLVRERREALRQIALKTLMERASILLGSKENCQKSVEVFATRQSRRKYQEHLRL